MIMFIIRSFMRLSSIQNGANPWSSCTAFSLWLKKIPTLHLQSSFATRYFSSHLNDAVDLPVIKLPVYYKEGMKKLKGSIRNQELEQFRRDRQKGNVHVPIIRCKARKLAHHDGQVYDPHRLILATYRWNRMKSSGQYFIIKPFAKNKAYEAKLDESPVTYLSGHIEQKFLRVNRNDRPDLLVNSLKKLNKLPDDSGHSPPFISVYTRKLSTAAYLEMLLAKEKLFGKVVKSCLSRAATQLLLQELKATNCNILIKLDSVNSSYREMDENYASEAEEKGFAISHLINYDCPESIGEYQDRFEDVTYGNVLTGRKRTVTTYVRFKLEAQLAQKIEKQVRLNT